MSNYVDYITQNLKNRFNVKNCNHCVLDSVVANTKPLNALVFIFDKDLDLVKVLFQACFQYSFDHPGEECCLVVDTGYSFTHIVPYYKKTKVREAVCRCVR